MILGASRALGTRVGRCYSAGRNPRAGRAVLSPTIASRAPPRRWLEVDSGEWRRSRANSPCGKIECPSERPRATASYVREISASVAIVGQHERGYCNRPIN